MPCSDDRDRGPSPQEIEDNHVKTRLACEACKLIESRGMTVPDWAISWWTRHKDHDRKREEQEASSREQEELRRKILSRMTSKERTALGI